MTNREWLIQHDMLNNKTLKRLSNELDDIVCDYCPANDIQNTCGTNTPPIGCEASCCDKAMENWLDDEADIPWLKEVLLDD